MATRRTVTVGLGLGGLIENLAAKHDCRFVDVIQVGALMLQRLGELPTLDQYRFLDELGMLRPMGVTDVMEHHKVR